MCKPERTPPSREALERELNSLEAELSDLYRDVGKALLETAETEGRRAGGLVDRIIETKRRLAGLREDAAGSLCSESTPGDPPRRADGTDNREEQEA